MKILYHCDVCNEGYENPEAAVLCESQRTIIPYDIGAKMVFSDNTIVKIVERTTIGKRHHDYLYRATMLREENPPIGSFWDSRQWYHHGQFTPHLKVAA